MIPDREIFTIYDKAVLTFSEIHIKSERYICSPLLTVIARHLAVPITVVRQTHQPAAEATVENKCLTIRHKGDDLQC